MRYEPREVMAVPSLKLLAVETARPEPDRILTRIRGDTLCLWPAPQSTDAQRKGGQPKFPRVPQPSEPSPKPATPARESHKEMGFSFLLDHAMISCTNLQTLHQIWLPSHLVCPCHSPHRLGYLESLISPVCHLSDPHSHPLTA